jgi:hypothetical protein
LYCHSFTKFEDVAFDDFNAIGNLTNVTMLMLWFSNLNDEKDAEYLALFFSGHKYPIFIVVALKVQQLLSLSLELFST